MIFKKKLYIKGMDLKQNNNRRLISLIAPLAIGFSLCACGSDNVAGGGPSGTEAGNAITAQILIANAPAANARVKLVEHNSLDGQGYTATANDSGYVTIENVAIGSYTMEATLDESALALQLPVDVKDTVSDVKLGQQNLQKSVFIGGSITDFIDDTTESLKNMNGYVKFRGLDHSAAITNGKFEIFGLPAGHLNMVIIPTETTDTVKVSVETDAGDSVTTLKPTAPDSENETLLIEDFEDGNNLHLYSSNFFEGDWNMVTITSVIPVPDSEKIKIYPELPKDFQQHPFLLLIQDSEYGGKEVHVQFDVPDTHNYTPWEFIKMNIGNSVGIYDLSSVDSIAFDAWGSGIAEIQVIDETRKDKDFNGYTSGKFPFILPSQKTTHKFAWADIVPNEDDRKRVTSISLVFHDDAELYFDNLKFIGKDLQNIWKVKE